jgi:3-oxoacyl-[acyl-carrier-protein] synthase III
MCRAPDTDAPDAGIVAAASYIPASRVRLAALTAHMPALPQQPADAREALMQSVYADAIRWQQTGNPAEPAGADCLTAPAAASGIRTIAVERELTLSDMALRVARQLLARVGNHVFTGAVDQIIVCQGSFEHDLTLSCACRLHCELGQGRSPFAVGQLQGVSFLMALRVTAALMATDAQTRTVLIVAAERWRPPFQRTIGALTALGDGAAAVLVQARARTGWIVRGITVRTPVVSPGVGDPLAGIDTATLTGVIHETCEQAGVRRAAIDWVLPAHLNLTLARDISAQCGLSSARTIPGDTGSTGYLGTADTPVSLDRLLRTTRPRPGQYVLAWSAGFQGQAACALLQFRGGGHVLT